MYEQITLFNHSNFFRVHGKISFAEISKNLARYRSENIFFIDHQDNWQNKASALMTMLQKVLTF